MSEFSKRVPAIMVGVVAIWLLITALWVKNVEPSGGRGGPERAPSDSQLMGNVGTDASSKEVDQIAIRIGGDGQVYMNDDPLDTRAPGGLPELTKNLTQLKSSCEASQSQFFITIYAADPKSQRVLDVLDSLGQARITESKFQLIEEK